MSAHLYCKAILISAFMLLQCTAHAEIYKWVDEKGNIHLSDKRGAPKKAVRIDKVEPTPEELANDNLVTLKPEADAMLTSNSTMPKGRSTLISSGFWEHSGSSYEVTSIIKFDLSTLIAKVNSNPPKTILSAQLQLSANTTDTKYKKARSSEQIKGHSSLKGSNSFYIKPVRSNWDENNITWPQFYDPNNYTPKRIRSLPSAKAAGSAKNSSLDYTINISNIISEAIRINMRELTLELRMQRRSAMAEVSFYSKEAEAEKQPTLTIELKTTQSSP